MVKPMSVQDKYRLAQQFIRMLENPDNFKFMDRFVSNQNQEKVLELDEENKAEWESLENMIKENDEKRRVLKQQRNDILL